MKLLLEMLPKKKAKAFPLFCEAIKFKYTHLYDRIMKAKQYAILQKNQGI